MITHQEDRCKWAVSRCAGLKIFPGYRSKLLVTRVTSVIFYSYAHPYFVGMDLRTLLLFLVLSLGCEVLGTVGGFGSSVFFVPMAGQFMAFKKVLGITALYHVSSNLSKIAFFKKGLDRELLLYLGIPAVLFVLLGGFLSRYISGQILSIFLGIFLLILSLYLLAYRNKQLQASRKNAFLGGALSGFLAGILGTGGAVRGGTMVAFKLPKEKFIATSAVIDLAIDASRSLVYVYHGYVSWTDASLLAFLLVISIAGTYLGKQLLRFIPQERFERLVLLLILGSGAYTLYFALRAA